MVSTESDRISKSDIILIAFGILDSIGFLFALPRLLRIFHAFTDFGLQVSIFISIFNMCVSVLQGLLYMSYLFSAYGFLRRKKWAFVLYYIQFPVRLLVFSLSLGFLLYINRLFQSLLLYHFLVITLLLAEIARFVTNVILHRRVRKGISPHPQ